MPFFVVTMTQTIEHEYVVEAFDEIEAEMLAHDEDAKKGTDHWYRHGYDGDVTTTAHELTPEEIAESNKWMAILSELDRKYRKKE
jgi:hypothetical protein